MPTDYPFRTPSNPAAPTIPRAEWDREPYNRWTFQNIRDILPTTRVWRGSGPPSTLPEAKQDIGGIRFTHGGRSLTVAEMLDETYTDGFLVLHKGNIVAETYMNGMRRETLHLSQSVAKSVTGAVAGILADRGVIDPAALLTHYLPELEATAYRGATLQHVLDMTSGTLYDETYTSPDSHMAKTDVASGWKDSNEPSWPKTMWQLILDLTETEYPHGHSFRYRSIETDVLAFVMQRASGKMLADLVSEELWQKLGAEEDAAFTVDAGGYALADGGFNATLRDYARFAEMITRRGSFNGRQIVPEAWLQATRTGGDHALFGADYRMSLPNGAYHNQFWIEDVERPVLLARGVFGQLLYMDEASEFTAVKLSSWPDFTHRQRLGVTLSAVRAIRDALVR